MDKKFEAVDQKFASMNQKWTKFEAVNQKFIMMDQKWIKFEGGPEVHNDGPKMDQKFTSLRSGNESKV